MRQKGSDNLTMANTHLGLFQFEGTDALLAILSLPKDVIGERNLFRKGDQGLCILLCDNSWIVITDLNTFFPKIAG